MSLLQRLGTRYCIKSSYTLKRIKKMHSNFSSPTPSRLCYQNLLVSFRGGCRRIKNMHFGWHTFLFCFSFDCGVFLDNVYKHIKIQLWIADFFGLDDGNHNLGCTGSRCLKFHRLSSKVPYVRNNAEKLYFQGLKTVTICSCTWKYWISTNPGFKTWFL